MSGFDYDLFVIGAGSGGVRAARVAGGYGAKVAVIDLNADGAKRVAGDIGGIAIKCDVSSAEDGEAALKETIDKLGAPRILVNCAGIGIAMKTVGKDGPHPLDIYRKVLEVNLIGTFNMIRLFADNCGKQEPMDGGERGVIINTASVAAYDGQVGSKATLGSAVIKGNSEPIAFFTV